MSSSPKPKRKPSNRRALSCFPCRRHKLKCDRRIPCQTCTRYRREDLCRQHPPSSAVLVPASTATGVPQRIAPAETTGHEVTVTQLVQLGQARRSWDSRLLMPCFMSRWPGIGQSLRSAHDVKRHWKIELVSLLPPRPQCDKLIGHFINHIDIMYHAIHVPTFLSAYQALWSKQVADVDLIWLALLFTIISATALLAPQSHVGALGLEAAKARELAMLWYDACRQSLFVGDYEARPTLTQIQVFLCTQTYWLETKNYEVLNSQLGQAVRNAQALGIDKDQPGAHVLETELRRRAFWELWVCDAYQSLCLDRTPLLSASPNVPKPVHCNDSDVTEDRVIERPLDEVTDMSANLAHYSIYIALRQGSHDMSSYEQVKKIDEEMKAVVARFPWYFQSHDAQNTTPRLDAIAWQYNILHMGISLLRIRINRPFMHAKIGDAWYVCADAAQDILLPYRRMRQADPVAFLRSPKFVCQAYQAYTAAVAVAAFLLVERALPGLPSESMLRDVEMVINDLETSDLRPMLAEGVKVLRKMVRLFLSNQSKDAQARESIVTEIASVFGGEQHTRNYLKPRSPEAAPHARQSHATTAAPISAQPPFDPSGLPTSVATATFPQEAWPAATLMSIPNPILQEGPYDTGVAGYPMTFDFQAALDMLNCDQWFDFVMPTGFNEQHSF